MERIREKEPELYATYSDATYIRRTGIRHEKAVLTAPAKIPAFSTLDSSQPKANAPQAQLFTLIRLLFIYYLHDILLKTHRISIHFV